MSEATTSLRALPPTRAQKKSKAPQTFRSRFLESEPKILELNYPGLETRDLKLALIISMEEDLKLGAASTAKDLKYHEGTFG
ncbi:hypothetical protein MMC26_004240 [Xylographa opegraphella]|nr:hypothetical protein [Xylographa opegraphella]